MLFVRLANAFEYLDGLIHGRLNYQNGLETAFRAPRQIRCVCGIHPACGADHLELAARKCRFENVGRIHRGAGRTSPDEHMQLIDKEDGFGGFEFVDDAF